MYLHVWWRLFVCVILCNHKKRPQLGMIWLLNNITYSIFCYYVYVNLGQSQWRFMEGFIALNLLTRRRERMWEFHGMWAMKLKWHSYLVFSLGTCAYETSTETRHIRLYRAKAINSRRAHKKNYCHILLFIMMTWPASITEIFIRGTK
jgi:hypothetical protein